MSVEAPPPPGMTVLGWVGSVDPLRVEISRFDPRHATATTSKAFAQLKADIARTGGNQIPVLLNQLGDRLELVSGRHRLQACLELGVPIRAGVQPYTPHEAFETMVCACITSWSPFELGTALTRALDTGLYPSMRRLAQACGLGLQDAALAHDLVSWPDALHRAFSSPADITPAWARALRTEFRKDPDGVRRRAEAIVTGARAMAGAKVVAALRG